MHDVRLPAPCALDIELEMEIRSRLFSKGLLRTPRPRSAFARILEFISTNAAETTTMAEAASVSEEIFALISEEEKKSIPDVLTKRLEKLWETKVKEITALKIDKEKQKITGGE